MKTRSLLLIAVLAVAGCQAWHKSAPVADAQQPSQAELAPATPSTTRAVAATVPATTPSNVAVAAEDIGPRIYVAADADDATRIRNWNISTNYYPSGHVIAGPVYRIIVPPPRSDRWGDVVAVDLFETVVSIPQMLITPFWAVVTPPWTPVEYHGEQFPPSYTVNDPLPYYENEKVPGIIQMKR